MLLKCVDIESCVYLMNYFSEIDRIAHKRIKGYKVFDYPNENYIPTFYKCIVYKITYNHLKNFTEWFYEKEILKFQHGFNEKEILLNIDVYGNIDKIYARNSDVQDLLEKNTYELYINNCQDIIQNIINIKTKIHYICFNDIKKQTDITKRIYILYTFIHMIIIYYGDIYIKNYENIKYLYCDDLTFLCSYNTIKINTVICNHLYGNEKCNYKFKKMDASSVYLSDYSHFNKYKLNTHDRFPRINNNRE